MCCVCILHTPSMKNDGVFKVTAYPSFVQRAGVKGDVKGQMRADDLYMFKMQNCNLRFYPLMQNVMCSQFHRKSQNITIITKQYFAC